MVPPPQPGIEPYSQSPASPPHALSPHLPTPPPPACAGTERSGRTSDPPRPDADRSATAPSAARPGRDRSTAKQKARSAGCRRKDAAAAFPLTMRLSPSSHFRTLLAPSEELSRMLLAFRASLELSYEVTRVLACSMIVDTAMAALRNVLSEAWYVHVACVTAGGQRAVRSFCTYGVVVPMSPARWLLFAILPIALRATGKIKWVFCLCGIVVH